MKVTCIIHIYNEEYLLPFWLTYHKDIFDHGIIIDYNSTDNSLNICRQICPTWEIRQSRNMVFGAYIVDQEVQDIERTIDGYKIALNVTEFIIPLNKKSIHSILQNYEGKSALKMNIYTPHILHEFEPTNLKELLNSMCNLDVRFEISYHRGYRTIHNYECGIYNLGRHASYLNPIETNDLLIVWCGFYPLNDKLLERKLQIQHKIPDSDKIVGNGSQHLWDLNTMLHVNLERYNSGKYVKELNNDLYEYLMNYDNSSS